MILGNILYASGILFYTKSPDNSIYFLLGKNHENKWSDFGGRAELVDKCDTFSTAAREAWEETIGCVYDYELLRCRIKNYDQCIVSKTQGGKPYYMYLLYIPYSNGYRDKFISTKKFISKTNVDSKFLEINDVKWVSFDTVKISSIENGRPPIKLRNIFASNIQQNLSEILEKINVV